MEENKEREELQKRFLAEPTEERLWELLTLYEGNTFVTSKGLEYTYTVKRNRHGEKSHELLISRREKTITKSTVDMAFRKAAELGNGVFPAVVTGPKKLGVFGASYLYPVFQEIGLIVKTANEKL